MPATQKTSQVTFYVECDDLKRSWISTVVVPTFTFVTLFLIVLGAYVSGSVTAAIGFIASIALFLGAFVIGFVTYRTSTVSRTMTVDEDGLHYRNANNHWKHIRIENVRGWQVKRRHSFWMENADDHLAMLIVRLNESDGSESGESHCRHCIITTRYPFDAGQAIDRAKIHAIASVAPVRRHIGTIVIDRDSAMTWFASDLDFRKNSNPFVDMSATLP